MKNGKLLLFVLVIGILAGFLLLRDKTSDSIADSTKTAPDVNEPKAQEPQRTVIETQKPAVDEAAGGEPSDEVAAKVQENLAEARQILQQKAAIEKARPEENHHMPKVTLDAARRLGEIAELEAQHPEQAESFRDFYLECARDDNTMTVTRAQCLDRYLKASRLDAAEQKQFLAEFPDAITRLVEALQ